MSPDLHLPRAFHGHAARARRRKPKTATTISASWRSLRQRPCAILGWVVRYQAVSLFFAPLFFSSFFGLGQTFQKEALAHVAADVVGCQARAAAQEQIKLSRGPSGFFVPTAQALLCKFGKGWRWRKAKNSGCGDCSHDHADMCTSLSAPR